MSDTLKDIGIALVGLWLLNWAVTDRAEEAVRRQVRAALPGAALDARVESRGLYGMLVGRAWRVTVRGRGLSMARPPFALVPGTAGAEARHLTVRLKDVALGELRVRSLGADVPFVRVDAAAALREGRFVIRSAEPGEGAAVVDEAALARFAAHKYPLFRDVRVRISPGGMVVRAVTSLFAAPTEVEARGRVRVDEGRYIRAVDGEVLLGGKPVAQALAERLLESLNPVLDVENDLGLADWFYVTGVELGEGVLRVRARVTIPPAPKADE